MIRSMTGYGRGSATREGLVLNVEIKAVNHRFCDINIRSPRQFAPFEPALRKRVSESAQRGKVDIFITLEREDEQLPKVKVNRALAESYLVALRELQELEGGGGTFSSTWLAEQKDVLEVAEADIPEENLQSLLEGGVDAALTTLDEMRRAEGAALGQDMLERGEVLRQLLESISERAATVPVEWQKKLRERLTRLQEDVECDPQRLVQELALYADRCDISEELVRFHSHLDQFAQMLQVEGPIGRKMDFLVQEMNREANTIGSKGNDAVMASAVVSLKSELEKIREQVQNVV
ncbi:MAG: YicC family protein [Desulfuromonas sp.]|nr:MAG: YicC family protein [Desulfuromonas sp.]